MCGFGIDDRVPQRCIKYHEGKYHRGREKRVLFYYDLMVESTEQC